jgi:hypothetical protein
MSTPPPVPDKTEARVDALRDVVFGLISYNPLLGVYLKGGAQVPGARGRTFRELRTDYGCIKPGSITKVAKVVLTDFGKQIAIDWGLMNPVTVADGETTE